MFLAAIAFYFTRSLFQHEEIRKDTVKDIPRLLYYLDYQVADLIALNLPITRQNNRLVSFTDPMGETRLVLVQNKQCKKGVINSLSDLASGDTVFVRENVLMEPLLNLVKQQVKEITVVSERDFTDEELIEQVASGALRFVVCPENTVMVYKRFFLDIDSRVIAHPLYSYGWVTGKHADSLRLFLNQWLTQIKNDRSLKEVYLEYFSNQKVVNNLKSDYVTLRGTRLSPFDRDLRTMSRWIRWDWRLLASLVYHESNFRTGQISTKNAMGLMQLIPETAAKMGVDSTSSISQQLSAGVRYLKHLNDLLPDSIEDPVERISFILAAYNVGIGRVLKAREKAIQFGKDPNRWHGSVDYYLLRRARKDPHKTNLEAEGLSGDYKTEGYVDDILNRYYHYRNLIPE